jgi:hypothetical protein
MEKVSKIISGLTAIAIGVASKGCTPEISPLNPAQLTPKNGAVRVYDDLTYGVSKAKTKCTAQKGDLIKAVEETTYFDGANKATVYRVTLLVRDLCLSQSKTGKNN